MQMTRGLLRSLIGAFIIYIGFDLALSVYKEGGNPFFYIPAVLFMVIGAFISWYYYKSHKKELEEEAEDEEETESNVSISNIARMDLTGEPNGSDESESDGE